MTEPTIAPAPAPAAKPSRLRGIANAPVPTPKAPGDSGGTIILLVGIGTAFNAYGAFAGKGDAIKRTLAGMGVGVICLMSGAINSGFGVALAALYLLGSILVNGSAFQKLVKG